MPDVVRLQLAVSQVPDLRGDKRDGKVRTEAKIRCRKKKKPRSGCSDPFPEFTRTPKNARRPPGQADSPSIYLHQLVPAAGDDDGVAAVRGEAHARHPLRVALVLGKSNDAGFMARQRGRVPPPGSAWRCKIRPATSRRSAAFPEPSRAPLRIAGLVLSPPQKGSSADIGVTANH